MKPFSIYRWLKKLSVIQLRSLRINLILSFLITLVVTPHFLFAQDLSKHYIIAFDLSVGNYKPVYASATTLNVLSRILAENGFNRKTDRLSIVGYSMPLGNPSAEDFVRPFTDSNGVQIIWHAIPEGTIYEYFPNWPQGQPILDSTGAPYGSMQSLAKPFVVMETHVDGSDSVYADKTIMLVVSDDVVNGTDDDYQREWNHVSVTPGANTAKFRSLSNGVFDTMKDFNEEFKFVQTPILYKGKEQDKVYLSSDNNYKITPYEVVAAEKPSIHSVTDMPSPLPLKRVRGGYKLNMETQTISSKYQISSIGISSAKGDNLGKSENGTFDFVIPSSAISEGDTLLVSMRLLLQDGLYNGSVISSANDRYRSGMMVKQVVKLQDEAKVLGLFPLKDIFWWWFPNDIFTAVMIWDVLILLAIMGTVTWFLYRWNKKTMIYRVEPHEISLHCIQNTLKRDSPIIKSEQPDESLKKKREDDLVEFVETSVKNKVELVKPTADNWLEKQDYLEEFLQADLKPPITSISSIRPKRIAQTQQKKRIIPVKDKLEENSKSDELKPEHRERENIVSNPSHIADLVAQLQNPVKRVMNGLGTQANINRTK